MIRISEQRHQWFVLREEPGAGQVVAVVTSKEAAEAVERLMTSPQFRRPLPRMARTADELIANLEFEIERKENVIRRLQAQNDCLMRELRDEREAHARDLVLLPLVRT